jgi:hypothetical protein
MKTTKIFFATFTLGVLLTACWSSKHTTSQKQSSGKADTTAITNVVNKDTATVDSLTWYAGPIPIFESWNACFEYMRRQSNVIREQPIRDEPDDLHIKDKNGNIQILIDGSRMVFYESITSEHVPKLIQRLLPTAQFYILKVIDLTGNSRGNTLVCRVNKSNYLLPRDINFLLSMDGCFVNNFTIEEKIEMLISLANGVDTNYKIISMTPQKIKIGDYYTNTEVIFLLNNILFTGYLVLNQGEIYNFYYKDNDSSSYLEITPNHINTWYKAE